MSWSWSLGLKQAGWKDIRCNTVRLETIKSSGHNAQFTDDLKTVSRPTTADRFINKFLNCRRCRLCMSYYFFFFPCREKPFVYKKEKKTHTHKLQSVHRYQIRWWQFRMVSRPTRLTKWRHVQQQDEPLPPPRAKTAQETFGPQTQLSCSLKSWQNELLVSDSIDIYWGGASYQ